VFLDVQRLLLRYLRARRRVTGVNLLKERLHLAQHKGTLRHAALLGLSRLHLVFQLNQVLQLVEGLLNFQFLVLGSLIDQEGELIDRELRRVVIF
jgi:hypothetical protein